MTNSVKVPMKLKRPGDWPSPPGEGIVIPKGTTFGDESVTKVGWFKQLLLELGIGTHVPDKPSEPPPMPRPVNNVVPMPPCKPPRPAPTPKPLKKEKPWHYEIISEAAHLCTNKLNYYKEKNKLKNVINITATDNTTTILLEIYDY